MNRSARTARWLVALCVVTMVTLTTARLAAEPLPDARWPLVMVYRGENTWLGRYDGDGNFIRDPQFTPNFGRQGGSGIPGYFLLVFPGKLLVYEHRSGCLIRGTTVKSGEFVPDIGSTILDLKKDYDSKNPDRMIYNLHDDAAAKLWTEMRKKQVPAAFAKAAEPLKAGDPVGHEFIPFSKSHPGKPPKHARAIGDMVEFGHLSDEGEFIPDPDLPPVSRSGILGPIKFDLFDTPRYYTVPRPPSAIGPKQKGQKDSDPEAVWEYRSGRLIKGMLQATGNFVPELGSKVIDFKDYDPELRPGRIYNLPGTLKKKAE